MGKIKNFRKLFFVLKIYLLHDFSATTKNLSKKYKVFGNLFHPLKIHTNWLCSHLTCTTWGSFGGHSVWNYKKVLLVRGILPPNMLFPSPKDNKNVQMHIQYQTIWTYNHKYNYPNFYIKPKNRCHFLNPFTIFRINFQQIDPRTQKCISRCRIDVSKP